MTEYAARYPKLRYFFAAYFHQDWVDSDSFEDVVYDFLAEPAATIRQATRELEEFVGLDLSEKELEEIVYEDLGCFVHAPGLGLTCRQWLEGVLRILKKAAPN